MTVTVILSPEADLDEAAQWYEQRSAGLGVDLVSKVREMLGHIAAHPDLYPHVHGYIRRAQVKRFPYGVFYTRLGNSVRVIGILHNRRDPTAWQSRA